MKADKCQGRRLTQLTWDSADMRCHDCWPQIHTFVVRNHHTAFQQSGTLKQPQIPLFCFINSARREYQKRAWIDYRWVLGCPHLCTIWWLVTPGKQNGCVSLMMTGADCLMGQKGKPMKSSTHWEGYMRMWNNESTSLRVCHMLCIHKKIHDIAPRSEHDRTTTSTALSSTCKSIHPCKSARELLYYYQVFGEKHAECILSPHPACKVLHICLATHTSVSIYCKILDCGPWPTHEKQFPINVSIPATC